MDKDYKMTKVAHPEMLEKGYTLYSMYDGYIKEIMERFHVGKELAGKLFVNALKYNVVSDEVMGQIQYIVTDKLGDEEGV